MKKDSILLPLVLITLVWAAVFAYTFNRKLDLNGDNAYYYIYASSMAQGDGYSDISVKGDPPTSAYPPGYPILMTPLRAITESIVAQKILNGVFLLGAAMLLFLFLRANLKSQALALTASIAMLLNHRVLEFATMMMSEMSYLLMLALVIWLLYLFDRDKSGKIWWKNPHFWLVILCASYAYLIRTQGSALIVAVAIWLLATRRWRKALASIGGFVVLSLPWTLRNRALGLSANRYLEQITAASHWRPEAGEMDFGGIVERGFVTLKMLLTKALPNTMTPYMLVDYAAPTTGGEWLVGLLLVGLIVFGFWQLRRYFWLLLPYTILTLGIICLWSAPSGNRYITTLVPLLEAGLVVGVWTLIRRIGLKISPLWLLVPIFLFARAPLSRQHQIARASFPPAYTNFFELGKWARANLPAGSVIASRKPQLLYVSSFAYGCNYAWTPDNRELIRALVESKADYVVLEQLGYASTPRYLYPAIVAHPELFTPIHHLPDPDTYLIRFDRAAAAKIFE